MIAIGAPQALAAEDPGCLIEFETVEPTVGSHDVLVEVAAVAVNPVDTKIRRSLGTKALAEPRILGWDAAGTVVRIGSEVAGFEPGDRVFYAGDLMRSGCNAQLQSVDHRVIAKLPDQISFEQAAGLPLVSLTAWELLHERMGVSSDGRDSGKSLLVINGAGGVGSAIIPLAIAAGLRVIATASRPESIAWCRKLGAHEVIDHHQPLAPALAALGHSNVDFVTVFHATEQYWEAVGEIIAPWGAVGLIVEPTRELSLGDPYKAKCVRIAWEFMGARPKYQLPEMFRQGEILSEIASRFANGGFPDLRSQTIGKISAANLRTAHLVLEKHQAIGKLVLAGWE